MQDDDDDDDNVQQQHQQNIEEEKRKEIFSIVIQFTASTPSHYLSFILSLNYSLVSLHTMTKSKRLLARSLTTSNDAEKRRKKWD